MSTAPFVGSDFAGYHIESILGRGGMAEVYLARDLRLGRRIAMKLLSPDFADDARFRERFVRESTLAASIDHPHIIPIYGAGEVDGMLYIAMRYVPGSDLKVLIRREGTLDAARTVSILGQVSSALDAAHAHGLAHRDVKPANILLLERAAPDGSDHAYLSDFGLSKHQAAVSDLTATGQFVGTIDYCAPEQIEGKPIDGRTDIYSLGCVLYECLTGRLPFARENEVSTMFAHLLDPPPRLMQFRPDIPARMDEVLLKALAKRKEDRYDTCLAFMVAVRECLVAALPATPASVATPTARRGIPGAPPAAAPPPAVTPPPPAAAQPAPLPPLRPPAAAPPQGPAPAGPPVRPAPAPPSAAPPPAAPTPPPPVSPPVKGPARQPTWRLGHPKPGGEPRPPG